MQDSQLVVKVHHVFDEFSLKEILNVVLQNAVVPFDQFDCLRIQIDFDAIALSKFEIQHSPFQLFDGFLLDWVESAFLHTIDEVSKGDQCPLVQEMLAVL